MSAARKVNLELDEVARNALLKVLEQNARLLEPFEVAWLLSMSLSEVYSAIPRVKLPNESVRFDPAVIKEIRGGSLGSSLGSSLKTEKKAKSVGLSKQKGKIDRWL